MPRGERTRTGLEEVRKRAVVWSEDQDGAIWVDSEEGLAIDQLWGTGAKDHARALAWLRKAADSC